MIKRATRCKILVADHRKVGVTSKVKMCDISAFDYFITDQFSSEEMLEEIRKMGVTVAQVN